MNKSAIKNFSIEARKLLLKMAVTEAGLYDITKDRCGVPVQKGTDFEVYRTIAGTENRIFGDIIKKRANLVKAISEHGFESVMEEAAYTWFNRLIAVRFMEVNDYLPSRVRVLSSETGSSTPDVVTKSLDVELNMDANEVEAVQKAKEDNKYDEAFRLLFIKQCNELNKILPGLFETTDDYMELLLKLSYTNDGVVRMLVDSVPEEDFDVSKEGQVEIIGWMYQYYNTELKDETFALLKKNVKITKERIPAATQLFTPDWIVRYMVENSLGRLWIEHLRANDGLVDEKATAEEFGWKYYLPEAEQEESVNVKLVEVRRSYKEMSPLDIKCIDPCMGSGHILVYMFDVLMDIYKSDGYSERDAAFYILENNISGLDIDQRAYQLSYFALMMKGRGYNRRFFSGREIEQEGRTWRKYPSPDVRAIEESNALPSDIMNQIEMNFPDVFNDRELACIDYVVKTFKDAKEYGSILNVDDDPDDGERQYTSVALNLFSLIDGSHPFCMKNDLNILQRLLITDAFPVIDELMLQANVMSEKYDIVATNPPYLGISSGNGKLNEYVKKYYEDSKSDLYAVFIEKCGYMLSKNGFQAMITQHSWMFLSSYERLRENILNRRVCNMVHLGARAFDEISGEVVQTASYIISNYNMQHYNGTYIRLIDTNGEKNKEKEFFELGNLFIAEQGKIENIPGKPIAYWVNEETVQNFSKYEKLCEVCDTKKGLATSDNNRFLRMWHEVNIENFELKCTSNKESENNGIRWYPLNKGGEFRRWYGNNDYVINWENNGFEIRNFKDSNGKLLSRPQNLQYNFKPAVTWTKITSTLFSARMCFGGALFDDAAAICYNEDFEYLKYIIGFLNSQCCQNYLKILNPTMNVQIGDIGNLPIANIDDQVIELVDSNINIAKNDWDSFESSWDYCMHPFLVFIRNSADKINTIEQVFSQWNHYKEEQFIKMKENEEKLNKIFNSIYGLDKYISAEVEEQNISVRKANLERDIKSFISYAVGCMFGRFTVDCDKIVYAGGMWNPKVYKSFLPDTDNIIPITDEEYFDEDIVSRFVDFVKIVFGCETLEKNLEYIANVLGNKGSTPREIIRNYFIKDFYKDHCKIYQKRPIYWLFDSGKENGFKALIYMHRYDRDSVGRIRSDYLHKTQNAIEGALKNTEYIISSSDSAVDKAKATKDRDKYIKQLSEIRVYDQALAHVALQRIDIDLDDGVKHNYELFQGIEAASEGTKKQTIDLLAKL